MQLIHEVHTSRTELDGVNHFERMDNEQESERTERKRRRERDRRSELSGAFEDLGSVLDELDPRAAHPQGRRGRRDVESTRLDKLHRTTALLRRMHRDMIKMQNQIRALEQTKPAANQSAEASSAATDDGEKEVIVMVPTLTLQPQLPESNQSHSMPILDRRASSGTQFDVPSYALPSNYAAAAPQPADPYAPLLAADAPPPFHQHHSPSSQPYALPSDYRPLPYWLHETTASPTAAQHYAYGEPAFNGYVDAPPSHLQRSRSLSQGRCGTPEATQGSEEPRNPKLKM